MTDVAPARPTRGVIGIITTLVGIALMAGGLFGGGSWLVSYALIGVGALLVLAAVVTSIVRLAKGRNRSLAAVSLIISLLAVLSLIALRVVAPVPFAPI